MNSISLAQEFFSRLHGAEPRGHLVIWSRPHKVTNTFPLHQPQSIPLAAKYCIYRARDSDVYAAVATMKTPPQGQSRGTEYDVHALSALWADIDIRGPAHTAVDLPGTEQEAFRIVQGVELPPTVVLYSGFGLQVYWSLKEPFVVQSYADRATAKSLSCRFQALLRQVAQRHGWTLDATADLARLLRVPGTFNRKIPNDVRLVTAEYFNHAYCVSDFEEILTGIEAPATKDVCCSRSRVPHTISGSKLPPADLHRILAGCAWMRHCRDQAVRLPEPEWYRMLTVVARCHDPVPNAHSLSSPHPKYNASETNAKLRQASGENVAPVTCAYVAGALGGAPHCASCLFRGNIRSPIAIGRIDLSDSEPWQLDSAAGEHNGSQ